MSCMCTVWLLGVRGSGSGELASKTDTGLPPWSLQSCRETKRLSLNRFFLQFLIAGSHLRLEPLPMRVFALTTAGKAHFLSLVSQLHAIANCELLQSRGHECRDRKAAFTQTLEGSEAAGHSRRRRSSFALPEVKGGQYGWCWYMEKEGERPRSRWFLGSVG